MNFLKLTVSVFLLSLCWMSCENDSKDVVQELDFQLLIGKWTLTNASIDKIPTERLNGAYLEFGEGGVLSTNIMGSDEKGTYATQKKEKTITQETAKTIEYKIDKLVVDSLVLRMKIGRKNFKVILEK